ncbi:MAG TPA: type II toxin-antitoxin system MqsA family antitoxin [Chloroflexia bacterium]|jgi:YgiT-type zinc finger domain-containing protein
MRCVICKQAETQPGQITVMLDRDGMTLVVKGAPAQVRPNCGEEYLDEETSRQLLQTAEEAARTGIHVAIREYVAA